MGKFSLSGKGSMSDFQTNLSAFPCINEMRGGVYISRVVGVTPSNFCSSPFYVHELTLYNRLMRPCSL